MSMKQDKIIKLILFFTLLYPTLLMSQPTHQDCNLINKDGTFSDKNIANWKNCAENDFNRYRVCTSNGDCYLKKDFIIKQKSVEQKTMPDKSVMADKQRESGNQANPSVPNKSKKILITNIENEPAELKQYTFIDKIPHRPPPTYTTTPSYSTGSGSSFSSGGYGSYYLPSSANYPSTVYTYPRSASYGPTTSLQSGNLAFHSDGTSSMKIGNSWFHSDGTSSMKIGNSWFHSDGTSSLQVGNFAFHSDGTSSTRIGNFILHSGGASTYILGGR